MHSQPNGANRSKSACSQVICLLGILITALQLAIPAGAQTIATNTQAGLVYALARGGTVTFAEDGTIVLTNTLVITTNVTLDGAGHNIAISGGGAVRIFLVNSNITFTLKNLALINGLRSTTNLAVLGGGGALYNAGTANAINCVFSNNVALGSNYASSAGGAILNQAGTLNLTNCIFLTNTTTGISGGGSGGAIASFGGSVALIGDNFSANGALGASNTTLSAFGGALYASSNTTRMVACSFTDNQVLAGYGLYMDEIGGVALGGAICQLGGSLTMFQTSIATNSAVGGAVGWYTGNGGNGCGGGLFNSGTLTMTNCSLVGNSVTGGFYGNPAGDGDGGGLFNGGLATLVNCLIIGNAATGGAAGSSHFPYQSTMPGQGLGGGICNSNSLVLIGTTIASNPALGGNTLPYAWYGATAGQAAGGGLYNSGVCHATNDTIYGNSATGGVGVLTNGATGSGGGFYNNGGSVILAFQTVFANAAVAGTNIAGGTPGLTLGGGICATNGTIVLYNSIVASNASGGDFYVLSNAVTDGGNNLSSDTSFAFTAAGSHNNVNPLLGPLANNGGPTLTMLPQVGSPAIDAASSASTTPFDQRGLARPYGSASDIGAVEYYQGFSIQGVVQHGPANQPVTVTAGIFSTTTDPFGNYTLSGIPAGSYSVTPSANSLVLIPASQAVGLASDLNNVNFAAYQMNALTLESYLNPVLKIAYAGTNGQHAVVQSSATLSNWTPLLTNTVNASGIFEFQVTNTPGQPIQFYRAHSP